MKLALMCLSGLSLIIALTLSSFLFLGSTLALLTTFTLASCIPWLVSLGVMWYAGGLIDVFTKLHKNWQNNKEKL